MAAAQTDAPFWLALTPRLGADADFQLVRGFLQNSGFSYENQNLRLGVPHAYEYRMPAAETIFAQPIEDSLGALMRLFVQGLRVSRRDLDRLIPAEVRAAMESLFLLADDPEFPGHQYAPCALFAFPGGLVTACDRCCSPGAEEHSPWPSDVLYPPLFENTLNFVGRLPTRHCEAMLDIGTGTGIAALASSQYARQIWASDITHRAAYFAEFNRRLNGVPNITVVEGDLYEPVAGLTFDRIAVHPPYVPGKVSRFVYREGGEDGEQIFRRVVQGLPLYLRPGGRFYSMLMASDRGEETFEARIRQWLGPAADEFDVLVAFEALKPTAQFLADVRGAQESEKEDWRQVFAGNGTTFVVYGSVVIQRRRTAGTAATARVQTGAGLNGQSLDLLMDWASAGSQAAMDEMVLNTRPVLLPKVELHVTHRVRGGRLAAEEYEFKVPGVFKTSGKTSPWMAQTIAACDGSATWREHFERLLAAGAIPSHAKPEEFARMLHPLVANGVLTA
jgi:SAM-dependent methyltransferase